ncbi:transposase [Streptomyces syringium]|uniref:transposase n=1 Tax=Streptomyces syringium TaxID=76729 RepID=UPI0033E0DD0F
MCYYKPDERFRLIYRPVFHKDHKTKECRSSAWTGFRGLLVASHQQVHAPIVLVWDSLNTHRAAGLRGFVAAHEWVTVFHLPPYAPELNPVEGIWSLLRRGSQANTAFTDPDHLVRVLRHGLRQIQYRSHLTDSYMTATTSPTQRQHR